MPYKNSVDKQNWMREHKESVRASRHAYEQRNPEKVKATLAKSAVGKSKRWETRDPVSYLKTKLRNGAHTRSKIHKVPFNLSRDDIVIPEFCPVLGIKIDLSIGRNRLNSPSVDRVIPELGYIPTNICVISNRANIIKSFGTAEEHRLIADYIEKMKP